MRTAYSVETVRTAERELMARLPEGALMQRAAAGLAAACADLLGKVYGARVVLLVGSGDNGGDALYAGARLARRGAGVAAVLLAPDRAHQGGLRALLAAAWAGRRRVGGRPGRPRGRRDHRHRRPGRAAARCGGRPLGGVRRGAGGRRGPAERGVRRHGRGRRRGRTGRRDRDVRRVQACAAHRSGRRVRGGPAARGHRARPARRTGLGVAPVRGRGGTAADALGGERQVPAGRRRHRHRLGTLSGGGRAGRVGRPAGRGRGGAIRRACRRRGDRAVPGDPGARRAAA